MAETVMSRRQRIERWEGEEIYEAIYDLGVRKALTDLERIMLVSVLCATIQRLRNDYLDMLEARRG